MGHYYFMFLSVILNILISETNGEASIRQLPSALTFFEHGAFPKPHLFCRVHGVCRLGDGTTLLPSWMQSYASQLAKCGLTNVSFSISSYLNTSSGPSPVHFDDDNHQHQQTPKEQPMIWKSTVHAHIELSDEYRDRDLLGGPTPSADRYHLATTVTPSIHLLDLFSRPSTYTPHLTSTCVHPPPSSQFSKPSAFSNECNPTDLSNSGVSSLNSLLLIDSRIADTKDFQWPKSILRLIRSSQSGNFNALDHRDMYSWKVRSKGQCFRSILSTRVQTPDMPNNAISTDNSFFSENGLVRSSVAQTQQHSIANCVVKILILNRYGKRFIEGAKTLSSGISAYASILRNQASHINIQPEMIFFENSSFHEQVSVVQEAGVIVATHGESNANFIFARPETQIFEILPFGFRPKDEDYQNLSQAYGATYKRVTAQPDKQVFTACVRHFNPNAKERRKRGAKGHREAREKLLNQIKMREREAFLKNWNMFAETFVNGTIEHGRNILSSYIVPDEIREGEVGGDGKKTDVGSSDGFQFREGEENVLVKNIRDCAAYQRVSVDVRDLARNVVAAAARQCPGHTDITELQM